MNEEQKEKLDKEIEGLVDKVDKTFMRKMQKQMHLCAANCCCDLKIPMDRVQECIEKCGKPVKKSHKLVQSQLDELQSLFEQCIIDCSDNINKVKPLDPTVKQSVKYAGLYDQCAEKCADRTIKSVPKLFEVIKKVLEKEKLE